MSKIISSANKSRKKLAASLQRSKENLPNIAILFGLLVTLPLIAQASSGIKSEKVEPLNSDQSQKLAVRLNGLTPIAKEEPKKVEIVRVPDPEPAVQTPPAEQTSPAPVIANPTKKAAKKAPVRGTSASAVGSSWEQCVPFARELSGIQIHGYAGNIRANASEPKVGAVALYASRGHAAVVTGVNGDSVTIKESNWVPGKITERTVPKSALRGYVY